MCVSSAKHGTFVISSIFVRKHIFLVIFFLSLLLLLSSSIFIFHFLSISGKHTHTHARKTTQKLNLQRPRASPSHSFRSTRLAGWLLACGFYYSLQVFSKTLWCIGRMSVAIYAAMVERMAHGTLNAFYFTSICELWDIVFCITFDAWVY